MTRTAPVDDIARESGTRILIENATKDYGMATPAVDDISLEIEPGEFMTFLGPSGSGKTTTLNLIAGFESLSKGTIRLDGDDISAVPPHRRNLGMLFQNYALFPHLTVAQNVAYPLRERKVPKAEIAKRVSEVLALVQLEGRDRHYPTQLSGGQQQRVALARAIVFRPQVLLLDEPLGALDRNLRATLQAEIRRIHREVGSTFVFVTHDQEEAMSLSDRIALFNAGRLEQVGTPEELYMRPETLFTASFLGDSTAFPLSYAPGGATADWAGERWAIDPATVSPRVSPSAGSFAIVRPENISLTAEGRGTPPASNSAPARIVDIEFLGSYRTILVEFGSHGLRGAARVDAAATGFGIGDAVRAHWPVEQQRVVAA